MKIQSCFPLLLPVFTCAEMVHCAFLPVRVAEALQHSFRRCWWRCVNEL